MFYKSIYDIPVFNWFKCIDSKEYKYCLININDYKESINDKCIETFSNLYTEYIDTFGISQTLTDIIETQNEILLMKIEKAINEDKTLDTFITLKELELKDKLNVKQTKTNTAKVAIEKYLGLRINEKEVTVKEYYDYLEAIKEDNGRATN